MAKASQENRALLIPNPRLRLFDQVLAELVES
jgi:hypothetical protein